MSLNKRINITELAKKLGISVTSVSRALNGYQNISSKTKDKILKLLKNIIIFQMLMPKG